MIRLCRTHSWFPTAVALVLLAANVAAPFCSHGSGRDLLFGPGRNLGANAGVVRVRIVAASGVSQGFRAVVGVVKGGSGALWRATNPLDRVILLSVAACSLPSVPGDLPGERPHPPLRC